MAIDWKKIKEKLSGRFGSVYLRCDGYLIAAHLEQVKMKLQIVVYVNGYIKGQWWWYGKESEKNNMGDIARRFYCLKLTRQRKSEKEYIKLMEKLDGKRECKKAGLYDRRLSAAPWFSTPGAFIAHIKKNNKTVEVLDYPAYKSLLDELEKSERRV
jgi:hypothetical protein